MSWTRKNHRGKVDESSLSQTTTFGVPAWWECTFSMGHRILSSPNIVASSGFCKNAPLRYHLPVGSRKRRCMLSFAHTSGLRIRNHAFYILRCTNHFHTMSPLPVEELVSTKDMFALLTTEFTVYREISRVVSCRARLDSCFPKMFPFVVNAITCSRIVEPSLTSRLSNRVITVLLFS